MRKADATKLARDLRQNQTKAEEIVWSNVRNRRLDNLKFYRQYPIVYRIIGSKDRYFIADFYCRQHRLIIEIDGEIHRSQVAYDLERTQVLENLGYMVIRFSNQEVEQRVEYVLESIKQTIRAFQLKGGYDK